ncbi:MAG: hypothetical protein KF850_42195, partial [Labilithrix sp.]|nr:hypothetical protein [Labilithrix sp.]
MSTPWIVFDRDSRIDDFAKSALRVGAVFASTPSFRPELLPASEDVPVESSGTEAPAARGASAEPFGASAEPSGASAEAGVAMLSAEALAARPAMFPPTVGAPESVVEPSNLIVATDVVAEPSSSNALGDERAPFESASFLAPRFIASRGRLAAMAGACAGVVAAASIAALVLTGGARSGASAADA